RGQAGCHLCSSERSRSCVPCQGAALPNSTHNCRVRMRFMKFLIATIGVLFAASSVWAQGVVRVHEGPRATVRVAPGVRVRVAPPARRVEVRVAAPSPRHVWIRGYWLWEGGHHVWIAGHWEVPPMVGQVWVEPQWVQEGGEWVFYPGHWEAAAVPAP